VNRLLTPERNTFLIKNVKLFIIIFFLFNYSFSLILILKALYIQKGSQPNCGDAPLTPACLTLFCCNFFKSYHFVVTFLKVTLFLSVGTHRLPLIRFHLAPPTRFSSLSRPFIYIIAVYLYKLTEKQVR
jgi:hypothetical protein